MSDVSNIERAAADAGAAATPETKANVERAVSDVQTALKSPSLDAAVNIEGDVQKLIAEPAVHDFIGEIPGVIKETKAGYKTTEFWAALATVILTQVGALHLPGHYGATIATVAAVLGYVLSRGIAKAGVPHVNEGE